MLARGPPPPRRRLLFRLGRAEAEDAEAGPGPLAGQPEQQPGHVARRPRDDVVQGRAAEDAGVAVFVLPAEAALGLGVVRPDDLKVQAALAEVGQDPVGVVPPGEQADVQDVGGLDAEGVVRPDVRLVPHDPNMLPVF